MLQSGLEGSRKNHFITKYINYLAKCVKGEELSNSRIFFFNISKAFRTLKKILFPRSILEVFKLLMINETSHFTCKFLISENPDPLLKVFKMSDKMIL